MLNAMSFCHFDTVEEELGCSVFVCRVHRVRPSNHEDELWLHTNLLNPIDQLL